MFARETMTVGKWYGRSIPVPNFKSKGYLPFLVGSLGIVRSVLQENLGKRIRILFRSVETAQADQAKGLIVINESFLTGHFPDGKYLSSEETIASILGIIVHEAAHFAYSPATLEPFVSAIREGAKRNHCLFNETAARILGNIIEDVYIESEVERKVPTLCWMLDHTNRVFFDLDQEAETVEKAKIIEGAPVTFEDVGKVLDVLILAKTRKSIAITPWVDEMFFAVRKAAQPITLQGRLDLAVSVYCKLMAEMKEESKKEDGKGDSSEKSKEKSDEGEEKSDEGEGKSGADALKKSEKLAKGLTATPSERVPTRSFDPAVAEAERLLDKTMDSEITVHEDGFREGETLVVMEQPLENDSPLKADERYDRLAEIGRQRATVNRPYGQDRNRGTHIRKLYRIATDQKIFAETITMNSYKPMQVIILLDCSGSMSGEKIDAAAKATLGAAQGLVNARCDVAVYGHTANVIMEEVVIYKGKEFTEPISVLAPRLGSLIYGSNLAENKDGHAIRYVGRKFTTTSKRRLLIVISDGSPQAPYYSGFMANQHTKEAVDELRTKHIDVLSISITESAKSTNNFIYGKESNVFNTDPDVIEQVVRSLLVRG